MIFLEKENHIDERRIMPEAKATFLPRNFSVSHQKKYIPILEKMRFINLPYQCSYPNIREIRKMM
jgi:hypothetical protein